MIMHARSSDGASRCHTRRGVGQIDAQLSAVHKALNAARSAVGAHLGPAGPLRRRSRT